MEAQHPFALVAPLTVAPNAIERGLTELWQRAEEQLRGDPRSTLIRSCTLNFAVVLARPDLLPQAADTAAAVSVRHPCRIFLLSAEPQAEANLLQATVSVWCHLPAPGTPPVCCEQVSVEARGDAVRGLKSLMLGLLVPDVPLVVWWRHVSLDLPLFEELAAAADRLIVDSAELSMPYAALARLAARPRQRPLALTDLAWNRLTCWRELTAQFFDAPEQRRHLERLDRVTLDIGGAELGAEGLLWLGWLASRLGWTATGAQRSEQGYLCTFTARGSGVHAEVHCHAAAEALIRRVELGAGVDVRFVLEHQSGCVRAAAQIPAAGAPARTVPLRGGEIVQMLNAELDLGGPDRVYEDALAMATQLMQLLIG